MALADVAMGLASVASPGIRWKREPEAEATVFRGIEASSPPTAGRSRRPPSSGSGWRARGNHRPAERLRARHRLCWAAAGRFGVRTSLIAAPSMYWLIKAIGALYLLCRRPTPSEAVGAARAISIGDRAKAGREFRRFSLGFCNACQSPFCGIGREHLRHGYAKPSVPDAEGVSVMMVMVAISVCWYALIVCGWLRGAPSADGGYQRLAPPIDRVAGARRLFGAKLAVEP